MMVLFCGDLIQVSSDVAKLGGGFLTLKMVADMSRIIDGLLKTMFLDLLDVLYPTVSLSSRQVLGPSNCHVIWFLTWWRFGAEVDPTFCQ
jgi:hypothetical protein